MQNLGLVPSPFFAKRQDTLPPPKSVTHSICLPKVDHLPSANLLSDAPHIEQYDQSLEEQIKEKRKKTENTGGKHEGITQPHVVLLVTAREKKNSQN